ncbi:MAG: hypothetical protein RLY21_432 [Planctomycetota bacterium]|jgi:hypothetical protein
MSSPGSVRLFEIARARLKSAKALLELAEFESKVLAVVDSATRGECTPAEAESALNGHLDARDALIKAMRAFDDEWVALAKNAELTDDDVAPLRAINAEMKSVLDAVGVRDKAFVRELKSRRRDAGDGVKRAEAGVTAQRAYSPAQGTMQPRFTDRAG